MLSRSPTEFVPSGALSPRSSSAMRALAAARSAEGERLHGDDDARSFYHPPTHLTSVPQRVVRVLCVRRRWRNRRDDGRQRVVVDERALQQPRQEVLAQRKVPAKQMVTSE